jgi:hypothetical protein
MSDEVWKPVLGYEGLYEVSSLGKVKRLNPLLITDTPNYDWGDYKTYRLLKDGIYTGKMIHRIVAEAFIPNPLNKPLVNHKNFIKQDNRLENLEWVTHSENTYHSHHGKLPDNIKESYEYKKYLKLKARFAYLENEIPDSKKFIDDTYNQGLLTMGEN